MENPHEKTAQPVAAVAVKLYDPAKVTLARLSWMLPLICLGVSVAINVMVRPLGAIGGLIFIGGVLVGFILSIVGLLMAPRYRGVLGHAIGGLLANVILAIAIAGMFHAVSLYRDAVRKQQPQHSTPQ